MKEDIKQLIIKYVPSYTGRAILATKLNEVMSSHYTKIIEALERKRDDTLLYKKDGKVALYESGFRGGLDDAIEIVKTKK